MKIPCNINILVAISKGEVEQDMNLLDQTPPENQPLINKDVKSKGLSAITKSSGGIRFTGRAGSCKNINAKISSKRSLQHDPLDQESV